MGKKNKNIKYIHDECLHNMKAPNIIVPIVLDIISPQNVVDIGCGIGTWLKAFKNKGVDDVLGLDGVWCNTDLLYKYITSQEFIYADLERPIKLDKIYDLVVSLEVAEHISEENADVFVQSLVDAGKIILFSAAIPEQGGFNHINEQWPTYWIVKFKKHGYIFHDIIRNKIWDVSEIYTYYKQNVFMVAHESVSIISKNEDIKIFNIVHPETFEERNRYIKYIETGKRGVTYYTLLLLKSIVNKFRR
jgi:cyclopropane fatty-acyl-phospholipid synthase-like methyltransferase